MSITDKDRERATQVIRALSPEDAYVDELVYDGDVDPLITAVAAALAEERERARAPFLRVIDELEDRATNLRDLDGVDRLILGANRAAAHMIRQAAEESE